MAAPSLFAAVICVGSLELTVWVLLNSTGEPSSWLAKLSAVRLLWND
jgi:hypothetical protein